MILCTYTDLEVENVDIVTLASKLEFIKQTVPLLIPSQCVSFDPKG
jgi:hypothetical protein